LCLIQRMQANVVTVEIFLQVRNKWQAGGVVESESRFVLGQEGDRG
jgi:hypothetical protein